ncbi:hypothetical protein ACJX0J_015661, partial [Zea mays]
SVSPKASLVAARRPVAVKTVRASSSADGALGGDFHVDILPQHRQEQSLERTGDKTATEWVRDTVIVEERSGAETSEAETEETEPDRHDSATATAAASNTDDQPAVPGAEKAVQDTAAITGQPAAETTSATAPDGTEKTGAATGGGSGQSKVQEQPARQRPQEERHDEPA